MKNIKYVALTLEKIQSEDAEKFEKLKKFLIENSKIEIKKVED